MEGHTEKCVKRYWELACRSASAWKLAETPCVDDHQLSPEDFNSTRELAPNCAHIAFHMFALGQNWQTTLVVDGKHAGKIGHTLEHSL